VHVSKGGDSIADLVVSHRLVCCFSWLYEARRGEVSPLVWVSW
jgi:hypothetical protein